MHKKKRRVVIHTDGSMKHATREKIPVGAWYALLEYDSGVVEVLGGSEYGGTNNTMELKAVIAALTACAEDDDILVYTDSQYVVNAYNKWLRGWEQNGWKNNTTGEDIANKEMMQELLKLKKNRHAKVMWVKGHANNEGNNYVDRHAQDLANRAKYRAEVMGY